VFSALSVSQIVIFVFGTIFPFVINALVPAGGLHDSILSIGAAVQGLLLVLFRKPSDQGGSVATSGK